jgi:hypothetical protein
MVSPSAHVNYVEQTVKEVLSTRELSKNHAFLTLHAHLHHVNSTMMVARHLDLCVSPQVQATMPAPLGSYERHWYLAKVPNDGYNVGGDINGSNQSLSMKSLRGLLKWL